MSPVVFPVHLSENDPALYLGISLSTIRRWRRSADGPSFYRSGGVLRYCREALDSFIARNTQRLIMARDGDSGNAKTAPGVLRKRPAVRL